MFEMSVNNFMNITEEQYNQHFKDKIEYKGSFSILNNIKNINIFFKNLFEKFCYDPYNMSDISNILADLFNKLPYLTDAIEAQDALQGAQGGKRIKKRKL